jgi:flagella basal body P-ring formation protein FlgA
MPEVIKAGQSVLLRARGGGFVVTQEGKAQSAARAGEKVRVKTSSGRIVTGIATLDGQVQVSP